MAQNPTKTVLVSGADMSVVKYVWNLTTAAPTGEAMEDVEYSDRTWAMYGTLGGAVCTIEGAGTNVDANFGGLSNAAGAATLTMNATTGAKTVIEAPQYMRPKLTTVGVGADLSVVCIARRGTPNRT